MADNHSSGLKEQKTGFSLRRIHGSKSRLLFLLDKQVYQMKCKIIKHFSISTTTCGFHNRLRARNGVGCGDDKLNPQTVSCNSHSGKMHSTSKNYQTVEVSVFTLFLCIKTMKILESF